MTSVSYRFLLGMGLATTASLASSQSVRNDPLAPLPPGSVRATPAVQAPPRMAPASLRERPIRSLGPE